MNVITFPLACGMPSGHWWTPPTRAAKVWAYPPTASPDDLRELMRLIHLSISGVACDGTATVIHLRHQAANNWAAGAGWSRTDSTWSNRFSWMRDIAVVLSPCTKHPSSCKAQTRTCCVLITSSMLWITPAELLLSAALCTASFTMFIWLVSKLHSSFAASSCAGSPRSLPNTARRINEMQRLEYTASTWVWVALELDRSSRTCFKIRLMFLCTQTPPISVKKIT